MTERTHVVVIGAGVVGLCAAHELLTRGFQVTVIERDATPGEGCSFGNGGLIVPSHFEPLAAPGMIAMGLRMLPDPLSPFGLRGLASAEVLTWVARFALSATKRHVQRCAPLLRDMNVSSRALYEDTYADIGRKAGYQHKGELMVCRTETGLAGEIHLAEKAAKLGLNTRVLSKSDLKSEEPNCEYDAAGAVYFEDDAKLTPSDFMIGIRAKITQLGATILDGSEVTGFKLEGANIRAATLQDREIDADHFVLAAGAWSANLSRTIGLNVPILAGKGYGFTVSRPPVKPKLPALLIEGRMAVTPMNDGLRFVGTMELGRPDSTDVNEDRVNGMRRSIAEYYPAFRGFDLEKSKIWCGLRPCPPDGMPYIGRTAKFGNLVFATGHGMMGMSLGPISGRLVAEILANETPSLDLHLLSPDRYA